ncbi:MAG: hypothetical protein ABRQ32_09900 [Smithellaceae bacterium]
MIPVILPSNIWRTIYPHRKLTASTETPANPRCVGQTDRLQPVKPGREYTWLE